ncbi:MAG: lytic transglycosylase domain-containing protein [Rhodoferax sp.]|nr:lytic transglycosylase domain-containing protein [Rhodoferax sp.]
MPPWRPLATLGLTLGCTLPGLALADVWKVVDENGVIQFTNEPPGKKGQLVISSNATEPLQGTSRASLPDATAHTTVAVIHASPAYQAVHGSLSAAAQSYGVDVDLLKAVVATESAFNPKAVSSKGAVGLMQVMPTTAQRYGVQSDRGATVSAKLADPDLNIQTGTRYLADLLKLFGGQTELALAAYNAGEGAVARAGNRIPNYKETQSYVRKVMSIYQLLQAHAG